MLPSIEQKLMTNTSFKQLVASSLASCIKAKLDELTVTGTPSTQADVKVLTYCREKMRSGSILDHSSNIMMANNIYVGGLLTMFDDTEADTIVYTTDSQGSVIIDWDQSKPILVSKIIANNYLFGLAGCEATDFITNI